MTDSLKVTIDEQGEVIPMSSVLQRPTLVLNRNWQPVHVASVQRALTLAFVGSARIVEPETYQLFAWSDWLSQAPGPGEAAIATVNRRLKVPEVIALCEFDRLPAARVAFSKRNLFKRDHFTCQYCGRQPERSELTIDHVKPRALGGETNWENCVLACMQCNYAKADTPLNRSGMRLKSTPSQPAWKPLLGAWSTINARWKPFIGRDGTAVA